MMKYILALLVSVISMGCVMTPVEYPKSNGEVLYCTDENACMEVDTQFYYTENGDLVFWDRYYGIWVNASGGYWLNNVWYSEHYFPGFVDHYARLHLWHSFNSTWHGHYGNSWSEFRGYHGGFRNGGYDNHGGRR
jgi:hypothetical protein